MSLAAENPRAVIGSNSGARKSEDKSPATLDEARKVAEAAKYIQDNWPEVVDLLAKRKGKRDMAFRKLLCWAIKTEVRQHALAELISGGMNRKTMGEDQQRPDRWIEEDEEWGDGELGEILGDFRDVLIKHINLDKIKLAEKLLEWVKIDPKLREEEEKQKELEAIQRKKQTAKNQEREAAILLRLAQLGKKLRGHANKDAILAQHKGPERTAQELPDEAAGVLAFLTKKESKGIRPPYSQLMDRKDGEVQGDYGVRECIRLGLVRSGEPHLSKATDPKMQLTSEGAIVYAAWTVLKKSMRKNAPANQP